MEINSDQPSSSNAVYQFVFGGEKNRYQISIMILDDLLLTECTCGKNTFEKPCMHCEYVLAGKTSRIIGGDIQLHDELLQKAVLTRNGKKLVDKSIKTYDGDKTCRRCTSKNIVKLRYSITAQMRTLFRETKHHTYYCKDCKWTW